MHKNNCKLVQLKTERKIRNLSCNTMARLLNISKTYYWQIENGDRRLTYDLAMKLAKIFKTTPDNLFYKDYKELVKVLKERK